MKADVDKHDINKLLNISTSLNNLKAKVNDLDVGKVIIIAQAYLTLRYLTIFHMPFELFALFHLVLITPSKVPHPV